RVPDGDGARLPGQVRRVGKHVADEAEEARVLSQAPLALFIAVTEVLLDDRRVLVTRRVRNIVQLKKCHRAIAEAGNDAPHRLGVERSTTSRLPAPLGQMPARSTERWLMLWYASPAKFSAANFQLQGIIHFWTPPRTSEPPSRPSRQSRSVSR